MQRVRIGCVLPGTGKPLTSLGRCVSLMRGLLCLVLVSTCFSGCSWLRCLVGTSPEKSHQLAEQARQAEEAGDLAQAVLLLEEALDETPKDPHLHQEMARLMRSLGRPELAREHLERAVEFNPDDVEANVELAQIYKEHQQAPQAIECLEAALQNDPKHPTALVMRASLAEQQHDTQTAIETYYRVLCSDPNHVKARLQIARLELENQSPNLAAPLLRAVCQCNRATPAESAEARWSLGVAYGQENRWSDAVTALAEASSHRDGMTADDWYRLAYARGQVGDWNQAQNDVNQALRINPRHENAQAMLNVFRWQSPNSEGSLLRIGHSMKPLPTPRLW